mmetsp:Transcript_56423/g.157261  ORF Transcript_56423/g.157261 Transcript_56423/m.157261 type:complete len:600 (-) Transcript_56423:72-1871(-)
MKAQGKGFLGKSDWGTRGEAWAQPAWTWGAFGKASAACGWGFAGGPGSWGSGAGLDAWDKGGATPSAKGKGPYSFRKGGGAGSPRGWKGGGQHGALHGRADVTEKIFVGGLPMTATEETVQAHFSDFGDVREVLLKRDPFTGFSRGFAFVVFSDAESARMVLENFDCNMMEGRWIECKPAVAQEGWKGSWGRKGAAAPDDNAPVSEKLFVGGIPHDATDDMLVEYFSTFGQVVEATLKYDAAGRFRGFAFLTFASTESAVAVLEHEGDHVIGERRLYIKPAAASSSDGRGHADASSSSVPVTEKLFIGGLPLDADEERVKGYYAKFGTILEVFLKRDECGASRGYGFITFSSVAEAQGVLNSGDSRFFCGTAVEVRPAYKKLFVSKPAKADGDAVAAALIDTPPPTTTVLRVRRLPAEPKQRDVFKFFYAYGMTRIRELGLEALVEFTSQEECERAFYGKFGKTMAGHVVDIVEATQEEFLEAAARQDAEKAAKDAARGDSGKSKARWRGEEAQGDQHRIRPNDWLCPNCRELVFAKKEQCRKCGTPKASGIQMQKADMETLKEIAPVLAAKGHVVTATTPQVVSPQAFHANWGAGGTW